MPADNFHTARAKSLLAHYLKFGVTALGVHWDSDNTAEVNEIIDSIIDASTAASPSPSSATPSTDDPITRIADALDRIADAQEALARAAF